MKIVLISMIALLGISMANAQDFDTSGGLAYKPTLAAGVVDYVDHDAQAHALRTWENVRDNGGCNADFIPYEIAAYCFNMATNGYPPEGAIGGHGGSGD